MEYPADSMNLGRRLSGCFLFGETGWQAGFVAAVLATSAVALGCADQQGQPAGELTPQEEQALADSIESQARNLMAAWSELEPEPYLQLYSGDVQFFFGGWHDRAQFEKVVRKNLVGYQEYPAEIMDMEVEVLGRDAAVATLTYRAQPIDTAGESEEFEAAFTLVYERRDGDWKVVQAHESLITQEESE